MKPSRRQLVAAFSLFLIPALGIAKNNDELAIVKAIFAEVNSANLETDSVEYNDPSAGASGEIVQFSAPDTTHIRKLKMTAAVDDGGATTAEFYLDAEGAPRFVFVSSESIEYDDNSTPFLQVSQLRLYFDAGQKLISALTKNATVENSDEIEGALNDSPNKEVTVASIPAQRIVDCVEELSRSLNPERARNISKVTLAALTLYDEPEPPANKLEWFSIPQQEGKTYPSNQFTHEIFNEIIATAKLPPPEAEAPAIHISHTHRYPGDFSVSTLATTDRIYHDSIDSIRYRMDIRESPEDRIHVSFFGYQIRPRTERPRAGTRDGWVGEKLHKTRTAAE